MMARDGVRGQRLLVLPYASRPRKSYLLILRKASCSRYVVAKRNAIAFAPCSTVESCSRERKKARRGAPRERERGDNKQESAESTRQKREGAESETEREKESERQRERERVRERERERKRERERARNELEQNAESVRARVRLRARARPETGSVHESCIVELPGGGHFLFCTSMLRVVLFLPRDGCCWQVIDFDESCIVDVPLVCQFWFCTSMLHVAVCFLPRDCCSRGVHPVHHQASTKTTVNHHAPRKKTCR